MVPGLVNHCEFVKELMNYLEFVFFEKGNVSRIFDVCRHSIDERNRISHSRIFYGLQKDT